MLKRANPCFKCVPYGGCFVVAQWVCSEVCTKLCACSFCKQRMTKLQVSKQREVAHFVRNSGAVHDVHESHIQTRREQAHGLLEVLCQNRSKMNCGGHACFSGSMDHKMWCQSCWHQQRQMTLLLKHEQGCPAKDRPLSTKDGRLSVWHADQMMWSCRWCQPTNQGTMTLP